MDNILHSLNRLAAGKILILVDDVGPNMSGFLLQAAEHTSKEDIALMARIGGGIVLAPVHPDRAEELKLPQMSQFKYGDAPEFTISVDAREGITTGISAHDRALTLNIIANTEDAKLELVTPGHIFPVRTRKGGVLVRSGYAEASIDLLIGAKCKPVATLCHCLNKANGDYLNNNELDELSRETSLALIRISEVITWRMTRENIIEQVAESKIPSFACNEFKTIIFNSTIDNVEHLVLIKGDALEQARAGKSVLVRVQAESKIGDLLGLKQAPGRRNIYGALQEILNAGSGVFVYIRHPQKGVLKQQVEAITQKQNTDSNMKIATLRELGIGAQILKQLGIQRLRLLTNSSRPLADLNVFDLQIEQRVPFKALERPVIDFSINKLINLSNTREIHAG